MRFNFVPPPLTGLMQIQHKAIEGRRDFYCAEAFCEADINLSRSNSPTLGKESLIQYLQGALL